MPSPNTMKLQNGDTLDILICFYGTGNMKYCSKNNIQLVLAIENLKKGNIWDK